MTNFFIGTADFLYLVAREITDSLTWCRFSQTCKRANKICKELLTKNIVKVRRGTEVYTTLPNGKKHGLASRYKFDNVADGKPCNVYYRPSEHDTPAGRGVRAGTYKDDNRRILAADWWAGLGE